MIVFLFPGQGAQSPGMALDLYDRYASVRDLFVLASDVCGRNMKKLLFESSESDLKNTLNAQIAVVLASMAAREALRVKGIESDGASGHSLGQYSAMADAGVLDLEDVFRAVNARGRIMAETGELISSQKGCAGMAAVIGLSASNVKDAVEGIENVWAANFNSPVQTAIGGTLEGIDEASIVLKDAGARLIIPIKVSCPFHTPLMKESKEVLKDFLTGITFKNPVKKLWSDITAGLVKSGEEARSLLVNQVTEPVLWVDLEASVSLENPDMILEAGPGKTLSGLWAKSGEAGVCMPAGTLKDIERIDAYAS